ncbi:YARHG domain-containing protein [[Clostridium] aminophilum]|uniref:Zinc-ribbon domain-containing protein n=1 Tax=[Clostridium] aminophilum TaxID=1526 RepID=A0A1I6ISG8_9FIRM|nr:YARHG domain-containing protein [[Clostridium] aminophilum]SFR69678.1 zinc-ribbon domain-containing protein [[Clostridium] aminophilum]
MFCKECGKALKDGSLFCPFCGTSTGLETENKSFDPLNTLETKQMGDWLGNHETDKKKANFGARTIKITIFILVLLLLLIWAILATIMSLKDKYEVNLKAYTMVLIESNDKANDKEFIEELERFLEKPAPLFLSDTDKMILDELRKVVANYKAQGKEKNNNYTNRNDHTVDQSIEAVIGENDNYEERTNKTIEMKTPEKNKKSTTVKAKPNDREDRKSNGAYEGSRISVEPTEYYIFPESSKRLLTEADLTGLSNDELRKGRNEIAARYGRRFKDKELQAYFDSQSWYEGIIDPDKFDIDITLNKIEKKNMEFIKAHEK